MKTFFKTISFLGIGSVALLSCEPKVETPTPSIDGKIDASNFVSIGNSLTAGFASNGLYLEGQKVAYPVLMAQQFKEAGGGEFYAPLFEANQSDGTGYLKLTGFLNATTPLLVPVPASPNLPAGVDPKAFDASLNPTSVVFKPFGGTKISNWGVPGIRVSDLDVVNYGWRNPYLGRLMKADEKDSKSYQDKIFEQKPTFFSCWLGNNDVLGFSTSGGVELLAPPTDPTVFNTKYTAFVNGLMASAPNAKGVFANIADVTSIPFFTTVGPTLKDSLSKKGIKDVYEYEFNAAFLTNTAIVLSTRSSTQRIIDAATVPKIAVSSFYKMDPVTKMTTGDVFIPLTFSPHSAYLGRGYGAAWRSVISTMVASQSATLRSLPGYADLSVPQMIDSVWKYSGLDTTKPYGLHPQNPLSDNFILNSTESATAKSLVTAFNQTIKTIVDSRGFALVDANSFLQKITRGAYFDAVSTSASFLSGGAFSLDGVHLTPRGNALAANEFIKAVNARYGTKITVLNPGQYRGVTFP